MLINRLLRSEDAANCKIPLALYPTKDEDPTVVRQQSGTFEYFNKIGFSP